MPDPDSGETCDRACLCGYEVGSNFINSPDQTIRPYDECHCGLTLPDIFDRLNLNKYDSLPDYGAYYPIIPITPTNLSLLQWYQVNIYPPSTHDSESGVPSNLTLNSSRTVCSQGCSAGYVEWRMVPENSESTLARPFECFGDLLENLYIFRNYSQQLGELTDSEWAAGGGQDVPIPK